MRNKLLVMLLLGMVLLVGCQPKVEEPPLLSGQWQLWYMTGNDGSSLMAEELPEAMGMEPEIFDLTVGEDGTWSWPVAHALEAGNAIGSWQPGAEDPEDDSLRIHAESENGDTRYYYTFYFNNPDLTEERMTAWVMHHDSIEDLLCLELDYGQALYYNRR